MKSILLALLLCVSLPASAMSLTPLAQTLDQSTTTGTLRIYNDNQGEKRYQVVVDAWTAGPNGEKVQTATSDLTFYPSSVITLGPGKTQTLRWKRTGATPGKQQVYLVQVREVPLDRTDTLPGPNGFHVAISPSFVFPWIYTAPGLSPSLSARHEAVQETVKKVVNGKEIAAVRTVQYLTLINTGNAAARVSSIRYGNLPDPGAQMVLPGERLRLKADKAAPRVDFELGDAPKSLLVE